MPATPALHDAAWLDDLAARLLDLHPDPVPRFRIVRDLARVSPASPAYREAQEAAMQHRHVVLLRETQLNDGTWGRFHSQDASLKTPFPTTEYAVERALALGIDHASDVLERTSRFLVDHLSGRTAWCDPREKHDDPRLWDYNTPFISAAYLALLNPAHPLVAEKHRSMVRALAAAFGSGRYDREAEIRAHAEMAGFVSKRFRPCVDKYALMLFAALPDALPGSLEDALIAHILQQPDGIYYTYSGCLADCPPIGSRNFCSWLNGHQVMAPFRSWRRHAARAIEWIWEQRNEAGLWDFGGQTPRDPYFPLSDSWHKKQNRVTDCSIRVLTLLAQSADRIE